MSAATPPSDAVPSGERCTERDSETDSLRGEVERLRVLVGPSEESYTDLRVGLLGARDAAIGAYAELGVSRAEVRRLEHELSVAAQSSEAPTEDLVARAFRILGRGSGSATLAARRWTNR